MKAFDALSDDTYFFAADLKGHLIKWSRGIVDYFGLDETIALHGIEEWNEKISPEDRQYAIEAREKMLSGKVDRQHVQYRVKNKWGEYTRIEVFSVLVEDGTGESSAYCGAITLMEDASQYDALTGLPDRHELYRFDFSQGSGLVMLLGIDDFRNIVSAYGYSYGDEVLRTFAKELASGADETQKIISFTGDEFILILPDRSRDDALRIFGEVCSLTNKLHMEDGRIIRLSVSAGAISYPGRSLSPDAILTDLELALRFVKSTKKGNISFYSDEIERKQTRLALIRRELRHDVDHGFKGFRLYFQPWVDMNTLKVTGCEALLRWEGESIRGAGPGEFIPVLEDTGDIIEVGLWVMSEALKCQRRWQELYGPLTVSFNVSYIQFLEPNFADKVISAAQKLGTDEKNVVIELTESCNVRTPEFLAQTFKKLRDRGFRIALDDFGTGFSSLELFKKLPSDVIKIDHNFVRGLAEAGDPVDVSIIDAIVTLSKRLDKKVVVEGVEDDGVFRTVRDMGVDCFQGYYYSRPVPSDAFEKMLQADRGFGGDELAENGTAFSGMTASQAPTS